MMVSKRKYKFLDVLLEYEGAIDLKEVETMFLQQRLRRSSASYQGPGQQGDPIHYAAGSATPRRRKMEHRQTHPLC